MTTISLVPPDAPPDAWASGVARIERMLAPKGFALDRWAQIAKDCAALVERHGNDLRRLGWSLPTCLAPILPLLPRPCAPTAWDYCLAVARWSS